MQQCVHDTVACNSLPKPSGPHSHSPQHQLPRSQFLLPPFCAVVQARLISRFHDLYLEPALRKLYPQVRLILGLPDNSHRASNCTCSG